MDQSIHQKKFVQVVPNLMMQTFAILQQRLEKVWRIGRMYSTRTRSSEPASGRHWPPRVAGQKESAQRRAFTNHERCRQQGRALRLSVNAIDECVNQGLSRKV